jgi:methanethiol oxidase
MTTRPDSTFYASPKLAMEAPQENFAYTLLLSPDFSKPDALAVIDVRPGSPTFSQIVHTVTMPHKGDEFHHFGWNACSSSLSPLTGHAFLKFLSRSWFNLDATWAFSLMLVGALSLMINLASWH